MKYIFCTTKDPKELKNVFKLDDFVIVYEGAITDFCKQNFPNTAYVCPCNHLGKLLLPSYFPNTHFKRTVNLDIGYSTIVPSPNADTFTLVPVITSASRTPTTKNLFWASNAVSNHAKKYNSFYSNSIKTLIFPDFSTLFPDITPKQLADQLSDGIVSDLDFDIFPDTPEIYFTKYGTHRR